MLPKCPLYDAPSCSPCTGLSELSMSKITRRCAVCVIARSTHVAFTRPNPSTLPSWVSTSVSNRLIVLVLAAGLSGPPRRPTTTRIYGQGRAGMAQESRGPGRCTSRLGHRGRTATLRASTASRRTSCWTGRSFYLHAAGGLDYPARVCLRRRGPGTNGQLNSHLL